MAGVPPLAGFYSKLGALLAMLSNSYVLVGTIAATLSAIGCFYYIKLVKIFFFDLDGGQSFWFGSGTKAIELFFVATTGVVTLFLCRPYSLILASSTASIALLYTV
jgi:NADH-quinone oxidoreductase subunit N